VKILSLRPHDSSERIGSSELANESPGAEELENNLRNFIAPGNDAGVSTRHAGRANVVRAAICPPSTYDDPRRRLSEIQANVPDVEIAIE